MKFLPLLFANLGRKKVRTLLTVGSVAVALFLFGLLYVIRDGFLAGIDMAGADRLLVINRVSFIQPLPLVYRDKLLAIPGVKEVTHASWFGGVYQDEKNFFAQFAIDVPTYKSMFPEFVVPDDQWEAFAKDRAGCIIGEATAKRFGFKIGDRIPIRGTSFAGNWEFNLRGIYRGTRPQDDTTQMWFHWDYLDERAPSWVKGHIGWFSVRVADPSQAVEVARAIDDRFANSPFETRAQTEKAMMLSFIKQMGNIELLLRSIGAVVIVTLLLVTGNTMAIAVRERTGELAVLKALGYPDAFVVALVLVESVLVTLAGGALGLGLAKLFTLQGDPTGGMFAFFYLTPAATIAGLVLSVVVGLLAGALPALSAMRLRVVDALRRA